MSIAVNGVSVDPGAFPNAELAAVHELLRQRAVEVGLLAPEAAEADVEAGIERLLEREVATPVPTEAEMRRYYDAHRAEFRSGELVFVRHILFQIAPGVPVQALRALAERTLNELLTEPDKLAEKARELSNCPSSLFGGNLGQVGRGDTVPEFEAALFEDTDVGILPALVKTRYGFHVVAVDGRVAGEVVPFEAAKAQIGERLGAATQTVALRQYATLLAGQAELVGVDLAAAATPLVQ